MLEGSSVDLTSYGRESKVIQARADGRYRLRRDWPLGVVSGQGGKYPLTARSGDSWQRCLEYTADQAAKV